MTSLPESYATQIEALAVQLTETVHDAGAARRVVEAAEEYQSVIAGRIADLSERRANIVARRGAGEKGPEDGASLALIQADLEGLGPILQEAAAKVQEAQRVHGEHAARASSLRVQIAHVEALAARDALIRHADDLSAKLLATVDALASACAETGYQGRPIWGAPPALFTALRKLAAARGEL